MKRDPSIHIKISDLERLLGEAGVANSEKVATYVLQNSKKVTLNHRVQVLTNKDTAARIGKLLKTNELTVASFNAALTNKRVEVEGGGFVQQIRPGQRDYPMLCEIAGFAYEFFQLYKYPTEVEAYTEFVEIGLRLMGNKYGLNKFITHMQNIFDSKKYQLLIENDPKVNDTVRFYQTYRNKILKETGIDPKVTKGDYLRFIDFYYARVEADGLKAKYDNYIEAQFEELSYLGTVPERYNLHGQAAKERFLKWSRKGALNKEYKAPDKDEDYLSRI